MAARKPLMAGNWKMNLTHLEAIAHVQKLAFTLRDEDYDAVDVAVIPPFTAIRSVQTLVDGDDLPLTYGAQDLSPNRVGAFTGDIAASQLVALGCTYVVVGHSERREHHGETDALVNAKLTAALDAGLTAILCVGEPLQIREEGGHVAHCCGQLDGDLAGVSSEQMANVVVAYEPVWAIGTGQVATPADAQEVCAAIRARLADRYDSELAAGVRILYGGSVSPDNAPGIMAEVDVDGALVGGASLDPEKFAAICRYRLAS